MTHLFQTEIRPWPQYQAKGVMSNKMQLVWLFAWSQWITIHVALTKAKDPGKRELLFADSTLNKLFKTQRRTGNICTHMPFSQSTFLRFWDLSSRIWLRLGKRCWHLLLCPPANHADVCLSALPRWGGVVLYLHLHEAMILELKRP